MRKVYEKLTVGKRKLTANNRKGLQYASGMVGPFQEDNTNEPSVDTVHIKKKKRELSVKEQKNQVCSHCFRLGHSRPTAMNCLLNDKTMEPNRK
jgi:hypothetical protein